MGLGYLLGWWIVISLTGGCSFILLHRFFRDLPDQGWGASRIVGYAVWTYLSWLIPSLLPIPPGRAIGLAILLIFIVFSTLVFFRRRSEILPFFRKHTRLVLGIETLFLGSWLLFTVFRCHMPGIYQAESFFEMSVLSGCITAESLPPEDPWFSGKPINYYYLGYFGIANLARFTGTRPDRAFNLGLALTMALLALGTFSTALGLLGHWKPALLAPVLTVGIGNFHDFFERLSGRTDVPVWESGLVIQKYLENAGVKEAVDQGVTEFPLLTFHFGQLHPHLMETPFLALCTLLLVVLSQKNLHQFWHETPYDFCGSLTCCAALFGLLPAVNGWSHPTVIALILLTVLYRIFLEWRNKTPSSFGDLGWKAAQEIALGVFLILGSYILYLPYWLLREDAGVNLALLPGFHQSTLGQFLQVQGLFLFLPLSFGILKLSKIKGVHFRNWGFAGGALLILTAWIGMGMAGITALIPALLLLTIMFFSPDEKELGTACLVGILGLVLLIGCEVVYVKFGASDGSGIRTNTVFKFFFEAWILLSISGAFFIARTFPKKTPGQSHLLQTSWNLLVLVLILAAGSYTWHGSRRSLQDHRISKPTLDGVSFFRQTSPGDYYAIKYIQTHLPPSAVILEAQGPIGFFSRISAFTGRKTLLGWIEGHESTHRPNAGAEIADRQKDIHRAFTTLAADEFERIAKKYRIGWVYIGDLERKTYGPDGMEKFQKIGELIFSKEGGKLYRLRSYTAHG